MKKAGIITMFGEYNFGNRLQNYAVQEVLKSKGLKAETIKYVMTNYAGPSINTSKDENRLLKFKEFNKYINFSEKTLYIDLEAPNNFADDYDYIVMGSDQIWNYSFEGYFCDKAMGAFAPKHKKFSFSASFGIDYLPEKNSALYNTCEKCLKDMKAISVREFEGKNIAETLSGRNDVEVLIDPTMMLNSEDWSKIMKKPENLKTDKFILKSFLGNTSSEINEDLNRIALENGCEIIDVSDKNSPFYDLGPSEFLYLEKNAFLVATDSFHSCVFAIIFSTPFVVFKREDNLASMYSRISTLVNKFKLENTIFSGKITDEIFNNDYSKVQLILEKERKKVERFLEKALN